MCPEMLMDATLGSLKSNLTLGYRKGATMAPEAPSTWMTKSQPFFLLSLPTIASRPSVSSNSPV